MAALSSWRSSCGLRPWACRPPRACHRPSNSCWPGAEEYVGKYEKDLGTIIAQEDYRQRITRVAGAFTYKAEREIRADFLMLHQEHRGGEWLGFRDVFEVDGRRVRDRRDRFQQLLLNSPGTALAEFERLTNESARYNVGRVWRNFNLPTFALYVLRLAERQRFAFAGAGSARVSGVEAWIVSHREEQMPALVTDTERSTPVFINGRLWIGPIHGRVLRTEVRLRESAELEAEIAVRYRLNRKLRPLGPSGDARGVLGRAGAPYRLLGLLLQLPAFQRRCQNARRAPAFVTPRPRCRSSRRCSQRTLCGPTWCHACLRRSCPTTRR